MGTNETTPTTPEARNTLFELASQALQLSRAILEAGGEITPEVDALLVVNELQLAQKADAYAAVLDRMEVEEELWRKRRDECERMLRAYEAVQERLKDRMKGALLAMQKDGVEGELVRFKLSRVKPRLVLSDADLPADFYITVTRVEPDKERIRAELEAGREVAGARLEQGYALRKYVNRKA